MIVFEKMGFALKCMKVCLAAQKRHVDHPSTPFT